VTKIWESKSWYLKRVKREKRNSRPLDARKPVENRKIWGKRSPT
jgi:hypothetical protein